jgi:hypothetical protein
MGRISKVDLRHRSRGTAQDETEAMAIAAKISKDLEMLYKQRPVLMDHAAAGNLNESHLSRNFVFTTTRSFRTYLSNYHSCFIHLHRVAHNHLPRSAHIANAMCIIKRFARPTFRVARGRRQQ